jgi:hypothetical protein
MTRRSEARTTAYPLEAIMIGVPFDQCGSPAVALVLPLLPTLDRSQVGSCGCHVCRGWRIRQRDPRWQLHVEVAGVVDLNVEAAGATCEDVAAALAGGVHLPDRTDPPQGSASRAVATMTSGSPRPLRALYPYDPAGYHSGWCCT